MLAPMEAPARPILAALTLPLQTSPTTLEVLGLLVGLPLVAALVITLLVRWPGLARPTNPTSPDADPVWVGPGGAMSQAGGPDPAAVESVPAPTGSALAADSGDTRGGASVRW